VDADQVEGKADFLEFISGLRAELASGGEDWENIDLPAYLEAMARWVTDWHGELRTIPGNMPLCFSTSVPFMSEGICCVALSLVMVAHCHFA
jgi:hypothetical protein